MRRSTHVLAVLLSLGLVVAGASGLSGAEPAGRWRIGKPHHLKVTHTTRVRVAQGTARIRVWHAEPMRREWPGLQTPFVAEKPVLVPTGANETPTRSEGGLAWKWDVVDPAVGEADYISTFELLSADRELKTSGPEIRWADLPKDMGEAMKGLPPLPTANARVREAVAQLKKKSKGVIDTLEAFAQWVSQNVAYTPGVAYPIDDLDAILKGRGGHCGHRATVYLALCEAAGIPARRVVGFALLNNPPGGAGVDDTNRHVWVQVNLPTLGWVEIEPAPHGSPFALSWQFVMCPFDLQARFVGAVSKAGAETAPVVADTLHVEELR